jgi:Alpha-L-fucosidase
MSTQSLCATLLLVATMMLSCKEQSNPPASYGPVPSAAQLEWQKMEYNMFIHFGPNTFTNVEWGDGKEDPEVFNPTDLDCRQWVATAKAAGMKGIIITAKHHDGFCLWPSEYSTHTVRESAWKDGKGDLLRELSDACKEYGLKFGVYLSPWDQNHPAYGTPEYNQIFSNTLDEVLTQYGEVFEQWFDGANGEGEGGKKQVYDWEMFHNTVYRNQPDAIIFSDIGPGCRWVGNEAGHVGETNWSRLDIEGFEPGLNAPNLDTLNQGNIHGAAWVPAETNTSIRPGWFYSPDTDDKVKSLEELVDIYYTSVGRNSIFLLNIPPDKTGRIHKNDSIRLMELKDAIDESFKTNLAKGKATATNTRGKAYSASNLLDGNYDSYWATADDVLTASVELELAETQSFNRLVLQEYIALGQRVAAFDVEYWDASANTWMSLVEATTIGYKRILSFDQVTTNKIRLNITQSLACPVLNNLELYLAPNFSAESRTLNTIFVDMNEPMTVDMGEVASIKGFFYVPDDKVSSPNITRYNLYTSTDNTDWTLQKSNARFNNIRNNPMHQDVSFDDIIRARYIRIEPLELANEGSKYAVAGFGAIMDN